MIANTIKVDDAELEAMMAETLGETEMAAGELAAQYVQQLAALLERDPRQYRGYGPYWWPLKAMLIVGGKAPFVGLDLERGTVEHYTHSTADMTVCAAWAYQQDQIAGGHLYTADHPLELEDGDTYNYQLYDPNMERFIAEKYGA